MNARNVWTVEMDNGHEQWIPLVYFTTRGIARACARRMRRAEGKRSRVVYRVAQFARVKHQGKS